MKINNKRSIPPTKYSNNKKGMLILALQYIRLCRVTKIHPCCSLLQIWSSYFNKNSDFTFIFLSWLWAFHVFLSNAISSVMGERRTTNQLLIIRFQSTDLQSMCLKNKTTLFDKPSHFLQKLFYELVHFHIKEKEVFLWVSKKNKGGGGGFTTRNPAFSWMTL